MRPQRCIVSVSDHLAGVEQGDCWRACLATVLDMSSSEVPNFVDLADDAFLDRTREWLAERGLAIFGRYFGANEWPIARLVEWLGETGPGVAVIVTGRSANFDHAVVALNGRIFDPSDCGISGPHQCHVEGCDCGGTWWTYIVTRRHEAPAP